MIRTYLDAGVYIATWRGPDRERSLAEALFRDSGRTLVSSSILRLELARNRNNPAAEVSHFQALFESISVWIPLDDDLTRRARELRTEYDLGALDALHVAAAEVGVVDQFVTTEKPGKPLHRVGRSAQSSSVISSDLCRRRIVISTGEARTILAFSKTSTL